MANAMECIKVVKMVDIFQVVKVLRIQRPGAVPTVVSHTHLFPFSWEGDVTHSVI